MALLLLAQKRAQDLGAPPVPLFVVRYDGIIVESDAIGPVTPEYFDSIFQRCLPIRLFPTCVNTIIGRNYHILKFIHRIISANLCLVTQMQ